MCICKPAPFRDCTGCSGCPHTSLAMRKLDFCICENKDADQLRSHREADLISAFVFAIQIVQSLYYLNPEFQASSHLLWLYSPVYVRPGQKPRRPVFSQRGSYCKPTFFMAFRLCIFVFTNIFVLIYFHDYAKKKHSMSSQMSLVVRKPVFGVSDQVRHKSGCTATEDG